MRYLFIAFSLVFTLSSFGGEREGHGGDPLIEEFHQRSIFVLNSLRLGLVNQNLANAFEDAYQSLRVDVTNDSLPTTGRVLPDPERPGLYYVLLDRAKFTRFLLNPGISDINAFVAHEVYETKGFDQNYEITRTLRFLEGEYLRWRVRYTVKEPSPNSTWRYGAISYSFLTGNYGVSWNWASQPEAESSAYYDCNHFDCMTVAWVQNGCTALASSASDRHLIGWFSLTQSRKVAESTAIANCSKLAGDCQLVRSVCTDHSWP